MAKHKVDVVTIKAGKNGKTGKLYAKRLAEYYEEYFNNPSEQSIISTLELDNATVLVRLTKGDPVLRTVGGSDSSGSSSEPPPEVKALAATIWVANIVSALGNGTPEADIAKHIKQQPLDRCEAALKVVEKSYEEHKKSHPDGHVCDGLVTNEKLVRLLKERIGSVS